MTGKIFIMFLSLKTGPAIEPVSLAEAKAHLRIDSADEDGLINSLITAARLMVEARTARALITQTWLFHLDKPAGFYELPLKPSKAITEISTFDENGTQAVLTGEDYTAEKRGEVMRVKLHRAAYRAEVGFVAGYGDMGADVPASLVQAILQLTAYWFENRGNSSLMGSAMPKTISALLAPYRNVKL